MGEIKLKYENETYKWIEINGKMFTDRYGMHKIVLIARDITKRKETQELLKESEEKYRFITENANDLIKLNSPNYNKVLKPVYHIIIMSFIHVF